MILYQTELLTPESSRQKTKERVPFSKDGSEYVIALCRLWVKIIHLKEDESKREAFMETFNQWQSLSCLLGAEVVHAMDRFMSLLARHCLTDMIMGCRCCGKLSPDEINLLSMLFSLQSGQREKAYEILARKVEAQHLEMTFHTLILIACSLQKIGLPIKGEILEALSQETYRVRRAVH
ncbi:hypothetical protein QGN29_14110 [Temperatibacter marinus]|uniref:Uncharacterized protein n=1 Tax=Temperatibacter marinus TaxID=1456591 RepID=A0AA52EFF2_9PROT|nr:hypothetical protein [Temperatibacter marinus]WND02683.1 hypothetical protein QGN29_14110 [Temperatibacter marinus]